MSRVAHSVRLRAALSAVCFTFTLRAAAPPPTVALRAEFARTLTVLVDSLERHQLAEPAADAGALSCPHCHVLHTRAAEAVWPMAMQFSETGDPRHLRALAHWLLRQQQPDGSWKETPEEWTGTTTDQLLMLVLTYESISSHLSAGECTAWLHAIEGAADYLVRMMSPAFASINYCATTTASLAAANRLVPRSAYTAKARELARATVAKMDEDGFLDGEGGRCHDIKMGVDLGYTLEMSFWGLAYYARLTGDTMVDGLVRRALPAHLAFIYPDGSMDGSWGVRSNKWTTYGSATSDGCQVLFMLYADTDPVYASAAWRNLQFLRTCLRDGLVDYGPDHAAVMKTPPCLYPTFAKAKNLALAMLLETNATRPVVALPTQRTGWQRHFPSVDVVTTRTARFMATTTAYGYCDIANGADSKYMFRPTGGAISCLWLEGHGIVQASSQTEYHRWEPMHFPEASGLRPLTPRIECTVGENYFTNLYEFDGRLTASERRPGEFTISTYGELKDRNWHYGGVSYRLTHTLRDDSVEKTITLHYRGATPEVRIVEPVIVHAGMTFTAEDARTVRITGGGNTLRLRLAEGTARLVVGRDAANYWSPYPALRAYPIEFIVGAPANEVMSQTVRVRLSVE